MIRNVRCLSVWVWHVDGINDGDNKSLLLFFEKQAFLIPLFMLFCFGDRRAIRSY